jgi:16S rRNA (cytidine1402-2'-O)-methyltransferase
MPLTVCATPIGNLDDVTLRVLDALRRADLVLCEDTRRTRILLTRHGVEAKLLSYHEHNEARRIAELTPRLSNDSIVLVSDAGLPGVNDPGARLVDAARKAGVAVTVLPGPSSVETALVSSGFAFERYQFVGFLPRGAAALAALWDEIASWPHAVVAFESPARLPTSLRSLAAAMPDRPVAVCRELTKVFEEVVRGSALEVSSRFQKPPKGEITVVLGPSAARAGSESEAIEAVVRLVEGGASRRSAADVVAGLTGLSRNRLYRASL